VTLRTKIFTYFIVLHVVLAGAAVFVIAQDRVLLFAVEALFLLSAIISIRLARAFFVPLDLIRTGAELISEREFTSRFVSVGQPELDSLIGIYNQMIDRLRDERLSAEERHQLLAKIMEASPSGMVILDFDGNVEQMNPAARQAMSPELREEMQTLEPGESRMIGQPGARRLRIRRATFHDRGFEKSFFVIEELTEELRLSEKAAYEKLIRMMSHEVNNSVGAVRSLLESSLRYAPQVGETDRDDFTNALTVASERIDSLNRFMKSFADVVRIPAPHFAPEQLDALLTRIAALLRPELDARAIALRLDLADSGQYAVDRNQIEQVVLNVIKNAMEAVDRDGTIAITLRDGVLSVADSGPGIPDSARNEIFTPFFTTKRDGHGLGLTIAQEILAAHGATFSLNNRDGEGAEFRIAFASER
jgi:signal transduction histidine kinase